MSDSLIRPGPKPGIVLVNIAYHRGTCGGRFSGYWPMTKRRRGRSRSRDSLWRAIHQCRCNRCNARLACDDFNVRETEIQLVEWQEDNFYSTVQVGAPGPMRPAAPRPSDAIKASRFWARRRTEAFERHLRKMWVRFTNER